jgi:hypothetical protein
LNRILRKRRIMDGIQAWGRARDRMDANAGEGAKKLGEQLLAEVEVEDLSSVRVDMETSRIVRG